MGDLKDIRVLVWASSFNDRFPSHLSVIMDFKIRAQEDINISNMNPHHDSTVVAVGRAHLPSSASANRACDLLVRNKDGSVRWRQYIDTRVEWIAPERRNLFPQAIPCSRPDHRWGSASAALVQSERVM